MKTFYQNMENDLKELLEQRQKICEMICANPFFGSDYTNRFIWEVKNHSYKNLGNYLLWCEYLLKIIKTSNELEQRRPSFHSVKILASNQELYNEIQKAYKSANVIKKNILLSNESDLDTHNNISQYILELNIFEKISPDLDFLRPKLQAMQTAIQAMAPIMERNKIIMYDFRNCFINCNMSIEILHKNLIKLIDKYGLEILNDYAKYAWYFYNSFDIKTIIEETEMLLSNWQVDDNTLISSQAFLEKIDSHFFVEFRAHYEAYQQVEQILNNVLNKHVTNWNIEFLEEVVQLYEFKMSKGRVSSDVLVEIHMDVFVAIKEKSTKSEQLRTRDGTGDLLWRLVTRGFLVDNYQIEKIELAIEEKWQIYHYKVIFYLNQLITNYQQRFDNYNMHIRKLIVTIKDYIFNKQLYCTYKIALYFIGEEPVNTANDAILMEQLQEVKEIALLSLQYNNFELVNYI